MLHPLPLRRAGPADVDAVRALTRAAYAKWVPLIGREPLPMMADFAHAVTAHLVDLYEPDGRLAALIEMIPLGHHLLIENIAVDPGEQGKGLGDQLVAHAETTARALGLTELRLYTNGAFAENLAFYAKRGFAETRREQFPGGGVVVHMARTVRP